MLIRQLVSMPVGTCRGGGIFFSVLGGTIGILCFIMGINISCHQGINGTQHITKG